jgi:hypothetical protein
MNGDLRAAEMVVQVSDKWLGHDKYLKLQLFTSNH